MSSRRNSFKFILALGLSFGSFASSSEIDLTSEQSTRKLWQPVGHNLRKFLSTNVNHYWAWMKKNAPDAFDANLLIEDTVIGDPHVKNILDVENRDGKRALSVVDLDDGGQAPLLLDAVRLFTILKANEDFEIKYRDMFDNYVAGINGKNIAMPQEIAKILNMKNDQNTSKRLQKFFDNKVVNHKFAYEALSLTAASDMTKAQKEELEKIKKKLGTYLSSQNLKIIDQALRVNDSGSSMGLPRYWFLIAKDSKLVQVLELKQMAKAAVSFYSKQNATPRRISDVLTAYGVSLTDDYRVVQTDENSYWMRPRRAQAIDLDIAPFDEPEFQQRWGLYLCYWLGAKQAKLKNGQKLRQAIANEGDLKSKIEEISRAYLDDVLSARE